MTPKPIHVCIDADTGRYEGAKGICPSIDRTADRDAVDNAPKRDADKETKLLQNAFVAFSHQDHFESDVDRCFRFKLRSDAETEPASEAF